MFLRQHVAANQRGRASSVVPGRPYARQDLPAGARLHHKLITLPAELEIHPGHRAGSACDAGQFAKDHIPCAVNIEWRKVFAERGKLQKDKTILVCCNTAAKTFTSCTAAMENGRRAAACRPMRERRR